MKRFIYACGLGLSAATVYAAMTAWLFDVAGPDLIRGTLAAFSYSVFGYMIARGDD